MAPLLLFFLTTITTLSVSSAQIIPLDSSISTTPIGSDSSFWLSPSGTFAFGFYTNSTNPQESKIGIWLEKSNEKPLVWQANRDDPSLSADYSLHLTSKGVILRGPNSSEKFIINSTSKPISSASMLDSGNFVLLGSDHNPQNPVWESFDYPTDTLLVGQKLKTDQTLVSDISESGGNFNLQLVSDSQLNISQLLLYFSQSKETISRTFDVYDGIGDIPGNNAILYVDEKGNVNVETSLFSGVLNPPSGNGAYPYRVKLDSHGNLRLFGHDPEKNTSVELWSKLKNPCFARGLCGLNSYCVADQQEPKCHCPPGFNFSNQENPFLGCERRFEIETCSGDGVKSNSTTFVPLQNTAWLGVDAYDAQVMKEDECKKACYNDCNCDVVMFNGQEGTCQILGLPLKYGLSLDKIPITAFIKVGNLNSTRDDSNSRGNDSTIVVTAVDKESKGKGKQRGLFVTAVALVICSAILLVISGIMVCHSRVRREEKIMISMESQST